MTETFLGVSKVYLHLLCSNRNASQANVSYCCIKTLAWLYKPLSRCNNSTTRYSIFTNTNRRVGDSISLHLYHHRPTILLVKRVLMSLEEFGQLVVQCQHMLW